MDQAVPRNHYVKSANQETQFNNNSIHFDELDCFCR